jgi:hypothetical protein
MNNFLCIALYLWGILFKHEDPQVKTRQDLQILIYTLASCEFILRFWLQPACYWRGGIVSFRVNDKKERDNLAVVLLNLYIYINFKSWDSVPNNS